MRTLSRTLGLSSRPPFSPARILAFAAAGLLAASLVGLPAGPAEAAQAAESDAIIGVWLTEDADARIEISRQGGEYLGRLVWLEEPIYDADDPMAGEPKVDRENPDPALRDRPLVGLPLLEGFRPAGDGGWEGGTIYDPESGKTYKSQIELTDPDTLGVRGYVGIPLFGRTTQWTRVPAEEGGDEEAPPAEEAGDAEAPPADGDG